MSSVVSARISEELAAIFAADGRSVKELILAAMENDVSVEKKITITTTIVIGERGAIT